MGSTFVLCSIANYLTCVIRRPRRRRVVGLVEALRRVRPHSSHAGTPCAHDIMQGMDCAHRHFSLSA
jgi:hypothetical protein